MISYTRKGKWLEYQISKQIEDQQVEEALKNLLHISGRMIQKLTRKEGIQVNGRKTHLQAKLKSGDRLQVLLFEVEEYGVVPEAIPIDICYEDEHLLVVNKASGLAVHPTDPNQSGTLANAISYHYQLQGLETKVRHVHRLDKDTSGLLLIAKHALAHTILDEQLRDRKIKRKYLAFATGLFTHSEGTIEAAIGRDRHHPTRRRVSPSGESAITHYKVLEQFELGALVQLELDTGRTHQIRVHLSCIGHPLLGDVLYGGPKTLIRRQALHAEQLLFEHPFTSEQLELVAPLPEDLQRLHIQLKRM